MLVRFLQPAFLTHYHRTSQLYTEWADAGDVTSILDTNGHATRVSLVAHSRDYSLVTDGDDEGAHWLYRWIDSIVDPETAEDVILASPPLEPSTGEKLAAFERIRLAAAKGVEAAYGAIYEKV